MQPNPHRSRLRFEGFDLDPVSGELTRDRETGREVLRIQPQPCKVLIHLAHRPGQVVSRKELYRVLWGEGTHVDAERGLNFCVKELRRTLDDDARAPRFIETLPRRGYRFVAEVEAVPVAPSLLPVADEAPRPVLTIGRTRLTVAVLALVLVAWGWFSWAVGRPPAPATSDGMGEIDRASAAYLEGRYLAARGTPEALEQSLESFQRAISEDPEYALAWVALSEVQLARSRSREVDLAATLAHAGRAAQRAVELAPESSSSQLARSRVLLYRDLDWRAAESAAERALDLDPLNAEAHSHHAFLLAGQGRHDEALAAAAAARRLDPERPAFQLDMGWYRYLARQYDDAVAACERALELEPGFAPALDCLESAHAAAGRFSAALGVEQNDDVEDTGLSEASAESRWRKARRAEITNLEQAHAQSHCAAVPLAVELTTVGDFDGAFARLEDALSGRSSWLPLVAVEPRLDPLHDDPRWADLVARLGLGVENPVAVGVSR